MTAAGIDPSRSSFASGAGGRLPLIVYALLAALCLALYLPGFFDIPPFDRDESRFAQASHQMLAGGDYVDIRFQDESRHKKPVGIYWMQAAATRLLADDPLAKDIWTFRVPSLIGAMLAVLATAWGGARLFGPPAGVVAAIMLASCVVLGVEARMAKTDAMLTACVAVAQLALARFYLDWRAPVAADRPGLSTALLFWAAVGVGILVKGPMILLFCGGTVAMLAAWDRSAAWLRPLRWRWGLALVALLVAPWLIAITIKTGGAFFAESVGHDMMGKVAGGQEGKGLPPGYYLSSFWITFQPWAFLALLAAPWAWRHRADPAVRFAIAWIIPGWLVFEIVPTKLLHYTLPAFAAIALLSARALLDTAQGVMTDAGGGRRLPWIACGGFMLTSLALCGGVAVAIPALEGRVDGWAAIGASLALLGFAAAARFALDRRSGRVVAAALAAALVLYVTAYGRVLPALATLWPSRWAAEQVAAHRSCPTSVLAAAGFSEPSLVFLTGTSTKLVHGDGAAAHLLADPACALALVDVREEAAFRAGLGGTAVQALAGTAALNYNNGRRLLLTLYRLAP